VCCVSVCVCCVLCVVCLSLFLFQNFSVSQGSYFWYLPGRIILNVRFKTFTIYIATERTGRQEA